MCGIVGYVGVNDASDILLEGLKRLEYRGYDSAGVALCTSNCDPIRIFKKKGMIEEGLETSLRGSHTGGVLGIGHTRWATHGAPSDDNAHPHCDCSGEIAVVHNGIIENHRALRGRLEDAGHIFTSEVDTEVIPHLIEEYREGGDDLLQAVQRTVDQLEGAYALAVVDARTPGLMIGVRKDSPLIVGLSDEGNFLASDVPAVLPHTRDIVILEDGDIAVLGEDEVQLYRDSGRVEPEVTHIDWDPMEAKRDGYPHFMLKEIEEQPAAWEATLRERLSGSSISLPEVELDREALDELTQVYLVGCGTSYHAGMAAAPLFERLLQVPVRPVIASEFRYGKQCMDDRTLVILISQSGETADTLACLRSARERACPTIAITNVVGSSMGRECDSVLYTRAGPEISVASTKTYTAQLLLLYMLACELGVRRGDCEGIAGDVLRYLPDMAEMERSLLRDVEEIKRVAGYVSGWEDAFFIGRGLDFAAALEGQLKLKEISYIHAEAYPAGELKHGTLALIEEGVPVIAVNTQDELRGKMASNIEEVRARGAWLALVTDQPDDDEAAEYADMVIPVPSPAPELAPFFVAAVLQLVAYYAAVMRDCPVDRPRNLAKSVTVE